MFAFEIIAEQRIREAMKRGEFDNLKGAGKPLPKDELDHIPEELRMSYLILKNADIVPEEIELKKSIITLQDLLNSCRDPHQKKQLRNRINEKQLRYRMLAENRGVHVDSLYYNRIMDKLGE